MLLKEIEKICKYKKCVILFTLPDGTQWLGTSFAAFPLENLPKNLSLDAVLSLLSITDSDRDKYSIQEVKYKEDDPRLLDFANETENEEEIEREFPAIYYNGILQEAYAIPDGIMFIDNRYVKFCQKNADKYRFFVRYGATDVKPFLVVKRGLFIDGMILPRDNFKSAFLCNELHDLANLCSLEYGKHREETEI